MKFYEFIFRFVILEVILFLLIVVIAGTFNTKRWSEDAGMVFIVGSILLGFLCVIAMIY